MNQNIINKKIEEVKELTSIIDANAAVIAFDFAGLNVPEFQALRQELGENNCECRIFKNNTIKRAVIGLGHEGFAETIKGSSALIFGKEEGITPLKILTSHQKELGKIELKAGIIENEFADRAKLEQLATLPTKQELYATLAATLQSPITKFAMVVKEVAKSKEEA